MQPLFDLLSESLVGKALVMAVAKGVYCVLGRKTNIDERF